MELLEELDLSKLENTELKEKLTTGLLGKRKPPNNSIKDDWETEFNEYYRSKVLKC